MRFRSTIIWVVILLLLGGFVYYYEAVVEKERTEAEEKAKKVFLFKTYFALELKLTHKGETIRCVKRPGKGDIWDVVEPVQAVADESAVMDVINGMADAVIERTLTGKADDLAAYGLDKPEYDIEFKTKDKTHRLLLGKKNPTGRFFYAKYADREKIFLVPYAVNYSLNKSLFQFRDQAVLRVNIKTTSALDIEIGGKITSLAKQEGGDWKVLQPRILDAGKDEVGRYISFISVLRVKKFLKAEESDPKITGLDKPSLRISLTVGDDKVKLSLLIGKKDIVTNQYHVRHGSGLEVFMLDGLAVDNLKWGPDDFRPKQIFSFDKENIETIELQHSDGSMVLEREKNDWRLKEPEPGPAKSPFVLELLSDILDLRAVKYIDGPVKEEYGFTKPALKMVLRLKGDKEISMLVGNKVEENVYVRVGSQNYLVIAGDVDQLKRDPKNFRQDDEKKE